MFQVYFSLALALAFEIIALNSVQFTPFSEKWKQRIRYLIYTFIGFILGTGMTVIFITMEL